MSLRDRTEVEPLPEAEWDRIEAGVFAELDSETHESPDSTRTLVTPPSASGVSRRAIAVAGAAVVVAAAAALLLFGAGPDPETRVASSEPALAPTRAESGAESARVSLGDVDVTLAPHTALVAMGSDASGWVVALERGSARFAVPPREGRPDFFVQAGAVRVEVVGTVFEVSREPASVVVSVSRGRVRVVHAGATASVSAGESWRSSEYVEGLGAASPAAVAEASPPRSQPTAPTGEPTIAQAAVAPRARAQSPAGRASADQASFERAAGLERSAPNRSERLYAELARGSGPWAAAALFAQARLAAEQGQRERAAGLARRYLRRFPGGLNALEARALVAP